MNSLGGLEFRATLYAMGTIVTGVHRVPRSYFDQLAAALNTDGRERRGLEMSFKHVADKDAHKPEQTGVAAAVLPSHSR